MKKPEKMEDLIKRLYQDDILMNEYRVSGTFSYQDEDEERLKNVSWLQDAHSEKEAAQKVLEEYEIDYPDACWLFGQPSVTFIRSVAERELTVSQYWTSHDGSHKKTIQDANHVKRISAI